MEMGGHHAHHELRHVCKFCSKRFGCGRSLGGHMRSHMINDTSAMAADGTKLTKKKLPPLSTYLISNPTNKKIVNTISGPGTPPGYVLRDNPRPSWKLSDPPPPPNEDGNQNLIMDSQSDNETATPNKKKISKRGTTRYTGPANSSMSFANNASSSASEIDQEQEEVAMCLILLSRDFGPSGGSNSPALDSSDKRKTEFIEEEDQGETEKIGRKSIDSFDPEITPEILKKLKDLDGEGGSIKFECTTCNKAFHSYGGHRASHKKTKGCFASKFDSSKTSIKTESSPDQTSDSNKLTNEVQADQVPGMDCEDRAEASNRTRKSKMHGCPICLRVFPSGQALGGHKRAHLVGAPNDLHHQPVATAPEQIILDLNLPAPVEGEINELVGFNPWWPGSNHNCEPLISSI